MSLAGYTFKIVKFITFTKNTVGSIIKNLEAAIQKFVNNPHKVSKAVVM